ncbi:MAG: hypothetical protein JNL71_18380 [Rhodospirillales bacterium]|nr:hypothetical protein [Rhodospirillales bacterium]
MSALYIMRYVGAAGAGSSTLYIGRQTVVGVDAGGARYFGTYIESRGRILVDMTLLMPRSGVLVTGEQAPAGSKYKLTGDWPVEPADGTIHRAYFDGRAMKVGFERVGFIP